MVVSAEFLHSSICLNRTALTMFFISVGGTLGMVVSAEFLHSSIYFNRTALTTVLNSVGGD